MLEEALKRKRTNFTQKVTGRVASMYSNRVFLLDRLEHANPFKWRLKYNDGAVNKHNIISLICKVERRLFKIRSAVPI